MRILYINPYAGGPGVGRYWRSFHLACAWQRQGHEVEVVSPAYHHLMDGEAQSTGCIDIQGVSFNFVHALKYSGNGFRRLLAMLYFAFSLLFFLLRMPRDRRPELIVYSSAHPFAYPAALVAAKLFGARLYFEVRDLWPLSLIEVAGFNRWHPIVIAIGLIEKLAYRCSDKVVSLLPGAQDYMVSKGAREDKFIYAPNGFSQAPTMLFEGCSDLLKDLRCLREGGSFVFFYAGALGEPNAMHKFIDALLFFKAPEGRLVQFVIVGKGEQYGELVQRCIKYNINNVSFYPQVDKGVVLSALSLVDAAFFVMHDLAIYRFGVSLNKLYDYMSAKVPIVGAYDSYNDPIAEARCGISVLPNRPKELASAFEEMVELNDLLRAEMGERGRKYLQENFEYSAIARRIVS
ncbi:putative glycosyl transferase [compost metagenome]